MHIETKNHSLVSLEGLSLINAVKKDFNLEITNPERIIHGYSSQVFKAHLKDEVVFIRINKKAQAFEKEILGYDVFKKLGIPVPELIAYQAMPATIGQPTMIISSAEGTAVGSTNLSLEQQDIVYERMGELLKKVHSVKLEGFGSLVSSGGELKGEFKSWKDYYKSRENHDRKSGEYLLENKLITEEEARVLKQTHEELSCLGFGQASLLHRDISGSHIFVVEDKITGVIDLGRLLAGDPRSDIATSFVFQTPRQREFFKKGYGGEFVNDPLVLKYLLTIAAGKASFRSRTGLEKGGEKALRIFRETLAEINDVKGHP